MGWFCTRIAAVRSLPPFPYHRHCSLSSLLSEPFVLSIHVLHPGDPSSRTTARTYDTRLRLHSIVASGDIDCSRTRTRLLACEASYHRMTGSYFEYPEEEGCTGDSFLLLYKSKNWPITTETQTTSNLPATSPITTREPQQPSSVCVLKRSPSSSALLRLRFQLCNIERRLRGCPLPTPP